MPDVKVCPNCGSTDVSREQSGVIAKMGLDFGWTCGSCGYSSKLFPEVPPDEVEAFRDDLEANQPDDHDVEEVARDSSSPGPGTAIGVLFIILGTGSLPIATTSFEGVVGGLLLPIGIYIIWQNQ